MLSIANEVDPLIFRCVCFVCNTNMYFSYSLIIIVSIKMCNSSNAECIEIFRYVALILNSKVMLKMYTVCNCGGAECNARKTKWRPLGNFIPSKIMQPPQSSGKVAPSYKRVLIDKIDFP